jgi:SAM-dependent methyltransferase
MKKLNLGCGNDIRPGWVNLDISPLDGIDIVHDISQLPLPFEDETFDYILCQDILEHVEYIPILKDLHRILKKGGIVKIRVPHFRSVNAYTDPTHKKLFAGLTFDFFVTGAMYNERSYYFDFHFTEMVTRKITFPKFGGLLIYNYAMDFLVPLSVLTIKIYERTFLSGMFPSENLIVEMRK